MFQVSFGGLIPWQTFQQDSYISSEAKLTRNIFENQETFSTLFKVVEEEPRLVGRTVKLTCSLVCTIYETRLNLIEDKNRVAQLFVGISLKRSLSSLFHINHTVWLISTYVNQNPNTFYVYRFQYRGIPPMTIVLDIESCKHFLCLLQFTQPKCSGWWQNCWANQKLTALSQRPDMRWCMQGQGVFPRKSGKYNGFHQLDLFSDWWYLWVMTSRQVTLLESPSPSSLWKESGRLLVIHMNDGATWPDRVLNGTNQWFHLLPHKHRAINVVIRWKNKLQE